MIVRNQLISSKQMMMLLVMFRAFNLLTFVPQQGGTVNAATAMLTMPLSLLLLAVVLLPAALLLRKRGGYGYIDCAMRLNKGVGTVLALLLFLYAAFIAADSISNFEFLLTSAVYPESSPAFFVVTFTAVCAYAAYMGLEPVTRVNAFIFVLFFFVVAFISLAILPKAEFVYLKNPLDGGTQSFLMQVVNGCFSNFDVIVWLLLAGNVKGSLVKSYAGWSLITLLTSEYLVLLIAVGLGDYASSRIFPFFSLAALSELSIFQRLDSLHITLWTFMAFIKVSVYLYLAAQSLGHVVPARLRGTAVVASVVAAGGLALLLSSDWSYLNTIQDALQTGIFVAVLAVLIPFALLLWTMGRERRVKE